MSVRTNSALLGASLLVLAAAAPAHAQTSEPASTGEHAHTADSGVGDVIVTAQKRSQNLQVVPVAETAIAPKALAANRIFNVLDLSAQSPGLVVTGWSGGVQNPVFTLRGENAQPAVGGAERQIGMYVDGVYVGAIEGVLFDLPYISQIEVLRGPQGTLFGQNATAGAISIHTPDPTGVLGGKMDFTYGNYDQIRAGGMINTPTVGPFSASLAFMHSERRGDIRNLGAGTTWDFSAAGLGKLTSPKWLGNDNSNAVNLVVKFQPTDRINATYKFFWVGDTSSQGGTGVLGLDPNFAGGLIGGLIANPATNPALLTPLGSNQRPNAVNNWFTLPAQNDTFAHILTAQWKPTDSITLKNTFGYMTSRVIAPGDQVDGLGGLYAAPNVPFFIFVAAFSEHTEELSDETQFNYNSKYLTLTAGYLHYDFSSEGGLIPGVGGGPAFAPVPNFVIPPNNAIAGTNHTISDAVYSQGEFHVIPKLDFVLGYRSTWDDKTGTAHFPGLPTSFTYRKSRPSYLAGINYRPLENIFLYVKYSTAYLAGGSSGGWAWNPETAESWEGGIRSDLFDRRLRLNVTGFSANYTGIQFVTNGPNLAILTGNPALNALSVANANAGNAVARGFEIETTVIPVERLTLGGSAGYTDFKYTYTSTLLVGPLNLVKPILRPKWTANMYAEYDTLPVYHDSYVVFRLDANYVSQQYGVDLPSSVPGLVGKGILPETWLVNGRVTLTNVAIAGHKAEIALWGKNLTDNRNPTYTFTTPFLYPTPYQPARTFGVDVHVEF